MSAADIQRKALVEVKEIKHKSGGVEREWDG
jgi:hypothetical protein